MIQIDVSLEDNASEAMQELVRGLTGAKMVELNEVGGRSAENAAREFHREFDARGGWRGQRSFGAGPSQFGADIWQGWFFEASDQDGATIANGADHFRFKVKGGTITPKRVDVSDDSAD